MKIRKWLSVFFMICFLFSLTFPAAATQASENEISAEPETEDTEEAPTVQTGSKDGFYVQRYAAPEDVFVTKPKAAMLIDLTSDTILYELDPVEQNYPASLTKIMTCWLALEHGNLNDIVTVSETALQNLHESGSTSGLEAGE